jgi:hypothetical protein
MTIFDSETDEYLERAGAVSPSEDWDDVVRRARRGERRARRVRVGAGGGGALAVAAVVLAVAGPFGGDSLLERAEAAVLAPVRAADGTIEHVLIEYRGPSGEPFIEYETWIAADGAWCRRTVEGIPGQVADTRLTWCRTSAGVDEVYLPATNEILRSGPGIAGTDRSKAADLARERYSIVKTADGKKLFMVGKPKPGAKGRPTLIGKPKPAAPDERADARPKRRRSDPGRIPGWLNQDVIEDFRRDAVHEAGTMRLDGREYAKLVTADRLNTILVDPESGEAVAWIPTPDAFGVPTTVVKTRRTLPDDASTRRQLSLTALYPEAAVLDVSAAERRRAIGSQYPRG